MAVWRKSVITILLTTLVLRTLSDEFLVHPIPCHEGIPCKTLEDYTSNVDFYFRSNTTFVFLENIHYLTVRIDLSNVTNITLRGNGGTKLMVSPLAGFYFTHSSDIRFESIQITNTGQENDIVNLAFSFYRSRSILLSGVIFEHLNSGNGRSHAIEASSSSINIANCSFSNGFLINGGAISAFDSDLSFFGETRFENNTADFSGGAIYANNSALSFNGDIYFSRNRAGARYFPSDYDVGGGGIYAWQTTISLNGHSEFIDNGPIHYYNNVLIGAAILAIQESNLTIKGSSVFRNNSGYTGGAIFLVKTFCHISGESTFLNNNATIHSGGAIFVYRSALCINGLSQFSSNYAKERGGGIYLEHSSLIFEQDNNFVQNIVNVHGGGAIGLLHSVMEISGILNFVENQGRYGGALELQGPSQIELSDPVSVNFLRNRARTGGAILISDSLSTYATQCQNLSIEQENCFYKVKSPNPTLEGIHLNFTENFVNYSGASIYGGTLELCRVQVNGTQSAMNGYEFYQNVSFVRQLLNNASEISSKPLKVCPCENGVPVCSNKDLFLSRRTVPGRTLNIEVIAVGQLKMTESANIVDIFSSANGSTIQPQPYNSNLAPKCHNVGYKIFTRNSVESLQIYPEGCNSYNASLFITIKVDQCPPGFQLIESSCQCEERLKLIVQDETSCDIETGLVKRPQGYWIQPDFQNGSYTGFYWSENCGLPYCLKHSYNNSILLNFSSQEADVLCQPNRMGVVCGSCVGQYSLVMHQLNCEKCEDKFLGLIIFFIFAGIGLICILLLLQITVAKGTIYGLILYCNFVNICYTFFFPLDQTSVNPLSLFIAWANLDFGVPTCLYNGMDAYSYTWLQFVFPFYLWLLIGAIIIVCQLSSRVGKLFGNNPVAVLATVVLLSFTKLLDTVVYALSYRVVHLSDGTEELRWWSDANIVFFGRKHISLAVFSIIVIAVILIPYIFVGQPT